MNRSRRLLRVDEKDPEDERRSWRMGDGMMLRKRRAGIRGTVASRARCSRLGEEDRENWERKLARGNRWERWERRRGSEGRDFWLEDEKQQG